MKVPFITKEGNVYMGKIVHTYMCFEGYKRYIIELDGKQYRCVYTAEGDFVEEVI